MNWILVQHSLFFEIFECKMCSELVSFWKIEKNVNVKRTFLVRFWISSPSCCCLTCWISFLFETLSQTPGEILSPHIPANISSPSFPFFWIWKKKNQEMFWFELKIELEKLYNNKPDLKSRVHDVHPCCCQVKKRSLENDDDDTVKRRRRGKITNRSGRPMVEHKAGARHLTTHFILPVSLVRPLFLSHYLLDESPPPVGYTWSLTR